jgi:hypothetical protein
MIQLKAFLKRFCKEILILLKIAIFSCTVVYLIPMTIYAYTKGGVSTSSMNTYTLTNGQKTVVFQSMIHIGLRSFYKEVGAEMTDYRNKGYRIFFEGIGSTGFKSLRKGDIGYEAAVTKYNSYYDVKKKILEKMESESIYKNSKYTYQGIELSHYIAYDDEYADLSYSALFDLAEKQVKENNISQQALDSYKDMDLSYSSSTDRLLNNERLYIYMENVRGYPLFSFFDKYLTPVVNKLSADYNLMTNVTINARDQNLVKHILDEPENLIYLTYGDAHFKGFLEGLQKNDPNWQIVSTTEKVIFKSD